MKTVRKGKEDNYILQTILKQLDQRGSKVLISYKGGNALTVKGTHTDNETLVMFLLGLIEEMYDEAKGNEIFRLAVKEFITYFLKILEEEE